MAVSKCAKINDLRVGRTLYHVRFNRIMTVKITKVIKGFSKIWRTNTVQIFWIERDLETYGFAGDMAVHGARYDKRPCMLYVSKGAAERAKPRIQAWEKAVHDYNERLDRDA